MYLKDSLPSAKLALVLLLGSGLPLSAINPPTPVPINKALQPIAVEGKPPAPTTPCWKITGRNATFYWPGAPQGAIWFGPVPICASGIKKRGGGQPSGYAPDPPVTPEPPVASGPSRNRACPGHVDCEESGAAGSSPPRSIRERTFLDIAPNQMGLGTGELTYYVDGKRLNLGHPEILSFNSIANLEAFYVPLTADVSRYSIMQPDGTSIIFNLQHNKPPTLPYIKGMPVGEIASSQFGVTWTLPDGSFASKTDANARLTQFVPGYGWVHFPLGGGLATGFTTITGRQYSLPLPGMEVIRQLPAGGYGVNGARTSGVLRQVKTPAGLLDIVPVSTPYAGRSFEIRQYAPAQVGTKPPGGLFPVTGTPVFGLSFAAPPSTDNQVTVVRRSVLKNIPLTIP